MTTLKPHVGNNPQQHIYDVKDYNLDVVNRNGATIIKHNDTSIFDTDDEVSREPIAAQLRLDAQVKAEQNQIDKQSKFDELYPSEQRLVIEKHYTPIIKNLSAAHMSACDRVTDFEEDQQRFEENTRRNWAFEGRHPDVQKRICQGDYHFNEMLKSGQLQIDGYKLVERRSNGGAIQATTKSGILSAPGGSSTLFFIPNGVVSLMHYRESPEAKAFSKFEYETALNKLIAKRKQVAVALSEVKQAARDALATIPSFDELISDSVKRAIKK